MERCHAMTESILQSWEKKLVIADPHWKVEQAFLSGMAGEGGGEVLKRRLMACLPEVDKVVSIEECLQQPSSLTSSTLWKFTSVQQQNILQAGVDLVRNMVQGVSPSASKDNDEFMMEVTNQLQYFCR